MYETKLRVALIKPVLTRHLARGTGTYARELESALKLQGIAVISAMANQLPEAVDLYHFPYFDPFFLTLPWLRRKKTVLTIHDLIPLHFPGEFPVGLKGNVVWQVQRTLAQNVSAVITDSESSRQDIERFMHVRKSKITVVYLAAGENYFAPVSKVKLNQIRKQFTLPEKFGLFVGDVNWNKNLPGIIAAMKKSTFPLVIVSQSYSSSLKESYHPWEQSLLKAQQAAQGYAQLSVVKTTDTSELIALYKLASFLIYPSLYEGFGLPVIEAFATGCPVITSDRGSLKEITGDAAIVVNPESTEAIIAAIKKLSHLPLRQQLISKGLKQARNFSWEKTARDTIAVYRRVLESR